MQRAPQHMTGALEQGPAKVEKDQDEQDGLNEQKDKRRTPDFLTPKAGTTNLWNVFTKTQCLPVGVRSWECVCVKSLVFFLKHPASQVSQ
jgi:hypothetical protein